MGPAYSSYTDSQANKRLFLVPGLAYANTRTLTALPIPVPFQGWWCPFVKQTSSHLPNGKFPSYYFSLEHQQRRTFFFFFNPCNTAAAIHRWVQVHQKWLAKGFCLDLTAYPSLSFIVTFPFSFQLLLLCFIYFFSSNKARVTGIKPSLPITREKKTSALTTLRP